MRSMRRHPGGSVLAGTLILLLSLGACRDGDDGDRAAPSVGGEAQADGASAPAGVDEPPQATGAARASDGAEGGGTASPRAAAPTDTPAPFRGTAGIIDERRADSPVATLTAVRTGRHTGFDRVVFEFSGERVPGYHTEYIDRPARQCGSGAAVPLEGDGLLQVRMSPVRAHTEEGSVTVADRERSPGFPVLKELKLTCDFEAVVEWVLGVAAPNRYRVQELSGPPRLVVDVLH